MRFHLFMSLNHTKKITAKLQIWKPLERASVLQSKILRYMRNPGQLDSTNLPIQITSKVHEKSSHSPNPWISIAKNCCFKDDLYTATPNRLVHQNIWHFAVIWRQLCYFSHAAFRKFVGPGTHSRLTSRTFKRFGVKNPQRAKYAAGGRVPTWKRINWNENQWLQQDTTTRLAACKIS